MILFSNLYDANRNLWRNKLRSFLTILAITVGSFAIIISLAIQTGTKSFVDEQFSALGGDNVMSIYPKATVDNMESMFTNDVVEYNDDESQNGLVAIDAEKIAAVKKITGIKANSVMPYANLQVDYVTSKKTEKKYRLNLEYLFSDSFNIEVSAGSKLDNKAKENQILLPSAYIEKLGYQDAESIVGETIILAIAKPLTEATAPVENEEKSEEETEGETEERTEETATPAETKPEDKFTELSVVVKGIIKDSMLAYSASGYALVNGNLADEIKEETDKALPESERDKTYILQAEHEDGANVDQIMADLEKLGLSGSTKTEAVEEVHNFLDIITIILYAFGGIALLVAAIGIVNTLLMSVQERTKEIGLKKALGMSSFRVFSIFSMESIMLGFWGSVFGIAISMLVGNFANAAFHAEGGFLESFPTFNLVVYTIPDIIAVMILIMVIAFIAGTLPARRASHKNPIDALRYE